MHGFIIVERVNNVTIQEHFHQTFHLLYCRGQPGKEIRKETVIARCEGEWGFKRTEMEVTDTILKA